MAISYKGLWRILLERELKKMDFKDLIPISNGTLAKLSKNEHVSLEIIEKICCALDCKIEDIVEIKNKEKE